MSFETTPTPPGERSRRATSRELTPPPSAPQPDVLLLDDEPDAQSRLAGALEERGFTVFASTAWSEVARQVFECRGARVFLVADLDMPGIRGEDFCRIIRSYNPNVVLVLFTGADRAEAEEAAQRLGDVHLVLKGEGAARVCELLEGLRATAGAS